MPPHDPAPIRGRWTGELNKLDQLLVEGSILGGGAGAAKIGEARAIVASLLAWPPAPDEAAIERGARVIHDERGEDMDSARWLVEEVLRAALEPTDP